MSDSFTRAAYSYQEEAMSLRTAEADSDLNHANYNEKDAMLIVIQNLIAENLELKRRLKNHENKCSALVQAVKESHEIYAERHNERAAEISNCNKLLRVQVSERQSHLLKPRSNSYKKSC